MVLKGNRKGSFILRNFGIDRCTSTIKNARVFLMVILLLMMYLLELQDVLVLLMIINSLQVPCSEKIRKKLDAKLKVMKSKGLDIIDTDEIIRTEKKD